jgi:hypothetical protein
MTKEYINTAFQLSACGARQMTKEWGELNANCIWKHYWCILHAVLGYLWTDEEISDFKENAAPESTDEATKFGLKLFRGRKLRYGILFDFISHKTSFYLNCRTII